MKILSVNAGSSSLKFRLYEFPEQKLLMKGMFERIGEAKSSYNIRIEDEKLTKETLIKDHKDAVAILLKEIIDNNIVKNLNEIQAVGHRIVHGGNKYSKSIVVNDRVLMELEQIKDLAPLHNPAHIMGIKAFKEAMPDSVMVACFDTAFHQTMKESTFMYPVPYEWYTKYDVRKYGFHGLSHQFITDSMKEKLNKDYINLIICHIGSGSSVTAVKENKCIDTSMGFTPNAGIMMGTRSGDIDYSMISYIMHKTGMTIEQIDSVLNHESGLEGISGMNDLRDIDRAFLAGEQKALLAVDIYTNKIVEYIAKYFVKLGHVDAIIFTAGGGENDPIIRKETVKKLWPLGIMLDNDLNEETIVRKGIEGIISTGDSSIPVYVIATDEELMIARDTFDLINGL